RPTLVDDPVEHLETGQPPQLGIRLIVDARRHRPRLNALAVERDPNDVVAEQLHVLKNRAVVATIEALGRVSWQLHARPGDPGDQDRATGPVHDLRSAGVP